ncbi:hypothetical protein HDU85_006821 [Gaertneriomyces sp. JEL0708]|nr:hypothetical protein HDU85_006821 [Gaertneriomyces sp. JEL0708]
MANPLPWLPWEPVAGNTSLQVATKEPRIPTVRAPELTTIMVENCSEDITTLRSVAESFGGFMKLILTDRPRACRIRFDSAREALLALETINEHMKPMQATWSPTGFISFPPVPIPNTYTSTLGLEAPAWVTLDQLSRMFMQYRGFSRIWYCPKRNCTCVGFDDQRNARRALDNLLTATSLKVYLIEEPCCELCGVAGTRSADPRKYNVHVSEFVPSPSTVAATSPVVSPVSSLMLESAPAFTQSMVLWWENAGIKAACETLIRGSTTIKCSHLPGTKVVHAFHVPTGVIHLLFAGLAGFSHLRSPNAENVTVTFQEVKHAENATRTVMNLLTLGKAGLELGVKNTELPDVAVIVNDKDKEANDDSAAEDVRQQVEAISAELSSVKEQNGIILEQTFLLFMMKYHALKGTLRLKNEEIELLTGEKQKYEGLVESEKQLRVNTVELTAQVRALQEERAKLIKRDECITTAQRDLDEAKTEVKQVQDELQKDTTVKRLQGQLELEVKAEKAKQMDVMKKEAEEKDKVASARQAEVMQTQKKLQDEREQLERAKEALNQEKESLEALQQKAKEDAQSDGEKIVQSKLTALREELLAEKQTAVDAVRQEYEKKIEQITIEWELKLEDMTDDFREKLHKQADNIRTQIIAEEKLKSAHEEELKKLKATYEDDVNAKTEEVGKVKEHYRKALEELKTVSESRQTLEKKLDDKTRELTESRAIRDSQANDIANLQTDIKKVLKEITTLQDSSSELKTVIGKLKDEKSRLECVLEKAKAEKAQMQETVEKVQGDLGRVVCDVYRVVTMLTTLGYGAGTGSKELQAVLMRVADVVKGGEGKGRVWVWRE